MSAVSAPEPKPSHLSGAYGAWFKDPLLVEAYPARPAYPSAVFQLLAELVVDTPSRLLDIGCGTGDLARRLAPLVERVDALDFSEAMLESGRRLPAGSASNLRWMLGSVEHAELEGPYALVTAGESLHWMDWDVVLPRLASVVTANGMLAIVERAWDGPPALRERVLPIIERYSPVRNYRPYNMVDGLTQRGLFEKRGEQRRGPEPWQPTIDEYLECRHSQRGLSRTHMGPAALAAFDAEMRQMLEQLCEAGAIAQRDGRLQLSVEASVIWGRPLAPPTAQSTIR
jgi:SAM-dependent methyltransferase